MTWLDSPRKNNVGATGAWAMEAPTECITFWLYCLETHLPRECVPSLHDVDYTPFHLPQS